MPLDDLLGDSETDPSSMMLLLSVESLEHLEDAQTAFNREASVIPGMSWDEFPTLTSIFQSIMHHNILTKYNGPYIAFKSTVDVITFTLRNLQ